MTLSRFPITFDDGGVALAVRAEPHTELPAALRVMGLTTGVPTIVLAGAGSSPAELSRLGPLLEKVVVAVAEEMGATVAVDGRAGGLGARVADARRHKKAGFPLVGVAPGDAGPPDLEAACTHFVLVPAHSAPALAAWTAAVGSALAGANRSVALAVAGGDRAWDTLAANVSAGRLVMAVARTGGVADQLAAAAAGRPADQRAADVARSGQLYVVDPGGGAARVAEALRTVLGRPDALAPGPAREATPPQR